METYKPISPKDVFMHFLSIIMLYAAAISFLVVTFQIINLLLPNLLTEDYIASYLIQSAYDLMRGALAFVVITYPVYIISTWLIKKSYAKDEYKKKMMLRRWLVYLTLFITAIIIIGTLIALLIGFLYGEFTLAFALKVLAVFFVAGSVFGYYIFDLKDKYTAQLKFLFYIVTTIVLIAVVVGFYYVGSPAKQRLRNIDQDKINNLEELNYQINNYYYQNTDNNTLPEQINEFTGYKKDFEYTIIDKTSYKICTDFNLSSYGYEYSNKYNMTIPENTWEHASGNICFTRKISSEFKDEFLR